MVHQKQTLDADSRPCAKPGAVLLETDRLLIRRFLMSDAPGLSAALNHEEVIIQLSNRFQYPFTPADAEAAISLSFPLQHDSDITAAYPRSVALCIKPKTTDNPSHEPRLIGSMIAHAGENMSYRTWSIGYAITPEVWGRGYATEALIAFSDWLLETWPRIARLEGNTFSTNGASAKVLLKAGFTEEGVRRSAVEKNGVLLDTRQFARLKADVTS
ncbi:hypothetical protein NLG97_g1035 [Lecanicillium saksenae]|uniref:Uncharacterized protein n=1 Tax=Lecanicillium saksenae TaxID=468837 RepID=A0ACC1R5H5_9HYPO|nr:hypothetical protein NLG97_g1035 [Lecanicillium saksenae]